MCAVTKVLQGAANAVRTAHEQHAARAAEVATLTKGLAAAKGNAEATELVRTFAPAQCAICAPRACDSLAPSL